MLNNRKIIGICATKIQDEFCSGFLQSLFCESSRTDYRMLIFNSFVDFFRGDKFDQGAGSIYKAINFDILDVLVIIDHCFYDKRIVHELIETARNKKIPVIVLYGSYNGCFSIVKNYTEEYKELISHVIKVHGARKLYFVAGTKGEENSDLRLACFREVMTENGLDIPENGTVYCNYWDVPVFEAVDNWFEQGALPQAIICANDTMAGMVCDRLALHGVKVPEDVIVTGFDGLESMTIHKPRLTTCKQDIPAAAALCFSVILDAVENKAAPYTVEEHFSLVISESCGCRVEPDMSYREKADRLYSLIKETRDHESIIYAWADRIQDSTDLGTIGRNLSENIMYNSAVAINSNLLSSARKNDKTDPEHPFTEKMVILAYNGALGSRADTVFELGELYPGLADRLTKKVMFVFQSIYTGEEVCGYYITKLRDITAEADKLHRLCHIMNFDFRVILSRIKQEHMTASIRTRDTLTGLYNLKGLLEQIDKNYGEYSKFSIVVSVYAIPRYKYIIENFGLEDAEEAVNLTAEALQLANPTGALISRISEDEFIIVNLVDDPTQIGNVIDKAVSTFFKIIEEYNSSRDKDYFVEVNCGCVVSMPDWEKDLMSFIKAANGEMYLNRMKTGSTPALKPQKSQEEYYRLFDLLIEKNLFIYHFQPIVSARTGEICAYEALMRTDSSINMNPGQILSVGEEYKRLYDIERATLFNVMGYIDAHPDEFSGKRVFINTIPGCFLNETDYKILVEKFGHVFSSCTIEITEQSETNDAELMQIKRLESGGAVCQLAIDDYGTGFSNIVNLLRYQPQVIKIDRFLIADVHKDTNKQLFISSTVEFARLNNILVLAEGVETREELSKVIELGVDLIQGFYTARPSAVVLKEIDPEISDFIASENARFFHSGSNVHKASDGEILHLSKLIDSGCTGIEFAGGRFILEGSAEQTANLTIRTADDTRNIITFENVRAAADGPVLVLGEGSKNFITLRGENVLGGTALGCEGIRVPSGAELTLDGDGDLSITSATISGVTLGGSFSENYGSITVDMGGTLSITATGENSTGIGGKSCAENEEINIVRGKIRLDVRGVHSVGIGSFLGHSSVKFGSEADARLFVVGVEAAAVGGISGSTDIFSDGILNAELEGEKITGIGVLNGGSGKICLNGGSVSVCLHGAESICVGSFGGSTEISSKAAAEIYAEGRDVCGIGNFNGMGSVSVAGGSVHIDLRSSNPAYLGSGNDSTVINSGNIIIERAEVKNAVNSFGEPLIMTEIPEGGFEAEIISPADSYIYRAGKIAGTDRTCVYLPENCKIKKIGADQ